MNRSPFFVLLTGLSLIAFTACEKTEDGKMQMTPEAKDAAAKLADAAGNAAKVAAKEMGRMIDEVDVAAINKEFETAAPEVKSRIGKAIEALKAENYAGALESLTKAKAEGTNLTEEQQGVLDQLLAQVKDWKSKVVSDFQEHVQHEKDAAMKKAGEAVDGTATKAAEGVNQATGKLNSLLGGGEKK